MLLVKDIKHEKSIDCFNKLIYCFTIFFWLKHLSIKHTFLETKNKRNS